MLSSVLVALTLLVAAPRAHAQAARPAATDSGRVVVVRIVSLAPTLDGDVSEAEYGAPTLELPTAAGVVHVWLVRAAGALYIAASLPDSTYYWGDDLVISVDPTGDGGAAPRPGDRQWYLRRALDSSVVLTAADGRWHAPDGPPAVLGTTRMGSDWRVASRSERHGWVVELRIDAATVGLGGASGAEKAPARPGRARLAFRTYNDAPHGWWSWPAPPAGLPAQRVERDPALWAELRESQP